MRDARRVLGVVAAVLVLLVVAGAGVIGWMIYRDDRLPVADADVIIADGSSVNDIAHQLEAQRVIADATLLDAFFRVRGGADRIQAAEYAFPAHETVAQVAARLLAGGKPPVVWLTIPEGYTAAQIARKLGASGLVSEASFARVARSRSLLVGGVLTAGLEGYLFPDTYQIPRRTTADAVADIMTRQFFAELPANYVAAARGLRMSVPQIVTIASMIEREAKVDAERPVIASVIYNRLRIGMPLEIDATIEYALPLHKTALSFADLAVDSPYNTYRHTGLPPTPISNPGKASLLAAFHPASTPYLYYVYKGSGRHVFSTTLEQQQENVRRYLR
jgi:UPF0755 protein